MTLFKKAALALVATSMVVAPVTASAAQAYNDVSAVSASTFGAARGSPMTLPFAAPRVIPTPG